MRRARVAREEIYGHAANLPAESAAANGGMRLRGLLFVFGHLGRRQRLLYGVGLVLAAVGGAANYFSVGAVRDIVDVFAAGADAQVPHLVRAFVVWLAASLVTGAAMAAGPWLGQTLERWVALRVQERLLSIAATTPYEVTESEAYRNRLDEARWAAGSALSVGAEWFESALVTVARIAALGGAVYRMAGVYAIGLVALALAARVASDRLLESSQGALFHRQTPTRRRREYLSRTFMSVEFQQEMRAFRAADHQLTAWRLLTDRFLREKWRIRRSELIGDGLVAALEQVALLGVAVLAGGAALRGEASLGQVVAAFYAVYEFSGITPTLSRTFRDTAEWLRGLGCLVALQAQASTGPEPGRIPAQTGHLVALTDVGYRYPGGSAPALSGVNLAVSAGRRMLLVGPNGAGKSTLIKVMLGLLTPAEGQVRAAAEAFEGTRPWVAVALQDFVRYPLTLRENVGVADPKTIGDAAAIERALRVAGGEALLRLPRGLDAMLSPEFGGVGLSEGQWQRVALARTAVSDAPLVLFDEPTHSLDPDAEAALVAQLDRALGKRSAVIASHRLSFTKIVDEVCVVADGRIVEQGAPRDLLAAGGLFARYYDSQRSWYRGEGV